MTLEEFSSIATTYLGRCVKENPQGMHSHNRYEAGWEIASLFFSLWRNSEGSHEECLRLKRWLAEMINSGDAEVELCLINATLEHLFEDAKIAKFFNDWRADPSLANAYAAAMLWPEQGGTSPIGTGDR